MNKTELLTAIQSSKTLNPAQKTWWEAKIPNLSQGLQDFLGEVLSIKTPQDKEKLQAKLTSMQEDLKKSWQHLQIEMQNLYKTTETTLQNEEFQNFLKQNDL